MAFPVLMGLAGGSALALENDAFTRADDLGSVVSARVSFDSRPATRQVGEPSHDGDGSNGTVWWRWTAPSDGLLWLDLPHSSSNSGTRVVYTGDALDSLIEVEADSSGRFETPVESGRSYAIVFAEEVAGQLELNFHPVPENDDFANREDLGDVSAWSVGGSTVSASREEGEPLPNGDSSQGPSIWWKWEAPEDGLVSFDLSGSDGNLWNVGVYLGDSLEFLEPVHESSRYSHPQAEPQHFRVIEGMSLSIVAAVDSTGEGGDVRLNWSLEPMAYQGNPETAIDLGSVSEAAGEGDTTAAPDVLDGFGQLIWWSWTAPANGSLRWAVNRVDDGSAAGSPVYDSDLSVLEHRRGEASYYCRAGETYYLVASTTEPGLVSYSMSFVAADSNDDLASAIPLVLGDNPYDLSAAGLEDGEPEWTPWTWDRSVWWSWTPPTDGVLWIEAGGRYNTPDLAIWRDDDLTAPLGAEGFYRHLSVRVEAGVALKIGLLKYLYSSGVLGPDLLRASFVPEASEHDDFADAFDLGSGLRVVGFGDTEHATSEPGEVVRPYGDASLWWKWTAPVECHVRIRTKGLASDFDSFVSRVFLGTGSTVDSLTEYVPGTLLPAGEILWISLGDWSGSSNPTLFELNALSAPLNDLFSDATDLGEVEAWNERWVLDGASLEDGEVHPTEGGSLWWKWTAPRDGNLEVFGANWHIYEGEGIGSLQRRGSSTSSEACRVAVVAGQIYHLALVGEPSMRAEIRMTLGPVPGGDRLDAPVDLGSPTDFGLLPPPGGTIEGDELAWFPDATRTFWWRWNAVADGWLAPEFPIGEDGPWHLFEESGEALVPVTDWAVSAGGFYRIAFASGSDGSVRRWLFHQGEGNDDPEGAVDLGSVSEWTLDQSVWGATVDADELGLLPAWASSATGGSWWRWTAPFDGALTIEARMLSSSGDCALVVAEGSDPAAMEVLLSPGTSMRSTQKGVLRVESGREYVILVGTRFWWDESDLRLSLDLVKTPSNDLWSKAADLGSSAAASGHGTNVGAVRDAFEESYRSGAVWWSWSAPATGNAFVTADLLGYGEYLDVFRSDGGENLAVVDVGPAAAASSQKAVSFRATAGERYLFRVAGNADSSVGLIRIGVQLGEIPDNDDFADRVVLSGDELPRLGGNLGGGTLEADGPIGGSYVSSAWWSWTPSASSRLLITPRNGYFGVLRGEALSSLEWLAGPNSAPFAFEFSGGETYHFAALSVAGYAGIFDVDFEELTGAGNDDFSDRIGLGAELGIKRTAHNFLTGSEQGEPGAGTSGVSSIWYEWTAPADGVYRIEATSAGILPRVGVYRGSAVDALSEVARRSEVVVFEASENEVLAVSLSTSSREGWIEFQIEAGAAPANDDFANRTLVEGTSFVLEGDTALATVEPGELGAATSSLWWEWVAPRSTTIRSDRLVRGGGLSLIVYESDLADPELGDIRISRVSANEIWVTAGRRYFFQAGDLSSSPGGCEFRVEVFADYFSERPPPEPVNNRFANRTNLGSEVGIKVSGNVYGATLEPGQSRSSSYGSIWWSWTAPSSGIFGLQANQGEWPRPLTVYVGDEFGSLTTVASSTSGDLWFEAEAGVSYAFEWWSSDVRYQSSSNFVSFEIVGPPASPENDHFADAIDLDTGWGASASGRNANASAEAGEPMHDGSPASASVWYRWIADRAGRTEVTCSGAILRTGIYQGGGFDDLVEIAAGTEPIEFDAELGQEYWIALDSDQPVSFSIRIKEVIDPPDSPDHFADAELLSGALVTVALTTAGATLEDGEPYHAGSSSQNGSVWYRWVAPTDGPVEVSGSGSLSYHLSVYLGDQLDSLTPVVAGRDYERVVFFAEEGREYQIAVSGSSSLSMEMRIEQFGVFPANDRFVDGTELSGLSGSAMGSLLHASRDAGEPWHASSPWVATVWYRWVAPIDGNAVFVVDGGGDEWLAVYRGETYGGLVLEGTAERRIGFSVQAGEVYSIAIGVSSYGDDGEFEVAFDCRPVDSNDGFSAASDLGMVGSVVLSGNLSGATREVEEPSHGGETGSGSLWWRWTAPEDGVWSMEEGGSTGSFAMAVYQGEELGGLIRVASVSSGGGGRLVWDAYAGESYLIAVDGLPDSRGLGEIQVLFAPVSATNDAFESRRILPPGLPATDALVTNGSSREFGDPSETGTGSLWWEWQPLESGPVDVDLSGCEDDAKLWVGVGPGLAMLGRVNLREVGRDVWSFDAVAGTSYQLAVSSRFANRVISGSVALEMVVGFRAPNDLFDDALDLAAWTGPILTTSRGAGIESGEPRGAAGSNRYRSLWWSWTAPRDGLLGFVTGSDDWVAVFHDADELGDLVEIGEAIPNSGRFRVEGGRRYRIAGGDRNGGALELELLMGPEGDMFDRPVDLGSSFEVQRDDSLVGGSWEQAEPLHFGHAPSRSRWYRWVAPSAGRLELEIAADNLIWLSSYSGGRVDRLSCLDEGADMVALEVGAGQELRLAVDTFPTVDPPNYRISLSFVPDGYTEWRAGHFTDDEPNSGPADDADNDGRSNLLELTMGTDPRFFDQGAAMSFDFVDGRVRLNLRRTAGLSGWSHHFEVSEDLRGWTATRLLEHVDSITDHGDGTETFHSLLPDFGPSTHPRLHFRPVPAGASD